MELRPDLLLRLLLASLAWGGVAGVLYDTIRLQRVLLGISRYTKACSAPVFCPSFCRAKAKREKSATRRAAEAALLGVQDVAFCLACGAMISVLLFYRNEGEFRGFVLLGAATGFAVYYFTVGRLVVFVSEYIVFAVKTAFLYLVYYATRPWILLGRFLLARCGALLGRMKQAHRARAIRRYRASLSGRLAASAERGFLEGAWEEKIKTT